jgi:hypothetical protein
MSGRGSILLVSVVLAGCAPRATSRTSGLATSQGGQHEPLRSTSQLGAGFVARQRVDARFAGGRRTFDAVLQLRDGVLTLVILSGFGAKAYVVTQRGTEASLETFVPEAPMFDPLDILRDVHRAYFLDLGAEPPARAGTRRGTVSGVQVTERWRGGRLRERVLQGGSGHDVVTIRYEDGQVPGDPTGRLVLRNRRFGYELRIRTYGVTRLGDSATPPLVSSAQPEG